MIEDKLQFLRTKLENVERELERTNFDYRDNVESAFWTGLEEMEDRIEELEKLKSSIENKDN